MKRVVVPFFIPHLGCPHRCVFCDQEKIAGARGALPDESQIRERVARYLETAGGREVEVAFYGGTFTALPSQEQRYLLGVLQPLIADGSVQSVRLSTRPDAVDAGVASFLKGFGVETVELGVQSMDEEVLRLSRRGHSAEDVERAVAALRDARLRVGIQLMPGLPGDTPERSLDSLRKVFSLAPDFLRIYPTLVIAGTELARRYLDGNYLPQSLDEAVSLCKEMLLAAKRARVPVVRLGLQPTAELDSPGVVLAGPYHPAFGQLVESELFYAAMVEVTRELPRGTEVQFRVRPGRVSDLVGQKRGNLSRLAAEQGVRVVRVREDHGLSDGEMVMEWSGGASTRSTLGGRGRGE